VRPRPTELTIGVEKLALDLSTMSKADLQALVAKLVASQPKPKAVSVKMGEKGGVVVSGLAGRFPTTLYRTSWQRLLTKEVASLILTFIKDNEAEITKVMLANGKHDSICDK